MPSRSFFIVPDQLANKRAAQEFDPSLKADAFDHFLNANIAPLFNEGSLATFMGLSTKTIFNITTKKSKHYRTFFIKKKSGGVRRVDAPRTYLKVVQWWLNDNILGQLRYPDYVAAFCDGRGPLYNALRHFGSRHILNVDLKDFFPSVKTSKVCQIFSGLGYSESVSNQLSDLTTFNGCLPQGAPTSPYLANLAASDLDLRINNLCLDRGFRYSRYADDITISCSEKIDRSVLSILEEYVNESGFSLNSKKTRFAGPGDRLEITGIVINEKAHIPRYKRKQIRAAFHNAKLKEAINFDEYAKLNGYLGALLSMGCPRDSKIVNDAVSVLKIHEAAALKERRSYISL